MTSTYVIVDGEQTSVAEEYTVQNCKQLDFKSTGLILKLDISNIPDLEVKNGYLPKSIEWLVARGSSASFLDLTTLNSLKLIDFSSNSITQLKNNKIPDCEHVILNWSNRDVNLQDSKILELEIACADINIEGLLPPDLEVVDAHANYSEKLSFSGVKRLLKLNLDSSWVKIIEFPEEINELILGRNVYNLKSIKKIEALIIKEGMLEGGLPNYNKLTVEVYDKNEDMIVMKDVDDSMKSRIINMMDIVAAENIESELVELREKRVILEGIIEEINVHEKQPE